VLGDEGLQLWCEHGKDFADLRRAHSGLVVLQEDVVGVVVGHEALDVPAAELDDALEPGPERLELGVLARLHPDLVRLGCGLRELDGEVGGDAARALPVAACDPDQRRVVGVVRKGRSVRLELLEEHAEAIVDDVRVHDLLERRELRRAGRSAARGHEDGHVPDEHRLDAPQVGELAQPLLQLREGGFHGRYPTAGGTGARPPAGSPRRPTRTCGR
jgi:hypothetical protein